MAKKSHKYDDFNNEYEYYHYTGLPSITEFHKKRNARLSRLFLFIVFTVLFSLTTYLLFGVFK